LKGQGKFRSKVACLLDFAAFVATDSSLTCSLLDTPVRRQTLYTAW